jgi:hypothetical protein
MDLTSSIPVLGSTHTSSQWLKGTISPRIGDKVGRGLALTSHFPIMSKSRIHESIHALPHTSSWRGA